MKKNYHIRHQRSSTRPLWRKLLIAGFGFVGFLVIVNLAMWVAYRQRVLPNVSLGAFKVSNIVYDQLDEKVDTSKLLVDHLTLTKNDQKQTLEPEKIGVIVDWPTTRDRLKAQRTWFPLLNLVVHRTVPVKLTVNDIIYQEQQAKIVEYFVKQALPERIVFSSQDFSIASAEPGYTVDQTTFKEKVLVAIETGQQTLAVPTEVVEPTATQTNLEGELQALHKKLAVHIVFSLNGRTIQPSAADIGGWFERSDQTMIFSADKAKQYIASLDGSVFNKGNAAAAASYALDKLTGITFVLATTQAPAKYTYCAATKGVDQSHLAGFIAKTAAVLGDPRGWNVGGGVAFERVETNCDFSLWLSAPSQMTSFGGVCDNYYSCRSGRNVVINFDRWQGATDPWNASGGSLEDYRVMVTNHEVGHWLGFGHASCPAPGQPAPVMQQQSINLQGCKFNPWPTNTELTTLKQGRGIAMLPAREDFLAVADFVNLAVL